MPETSRKNENTTTAVSRSARVSPAARRRASKAWRRSTMTTGIAGANSPPSTSPGMMSSRKPMGTSSETIR